MRRGVCDDLAFCDAVALKTVIRHFEFSFFFGDALPQVRELFFRRCKFRRRGNFRPLQCRRHAESISFHNARVSSVERPCADIMPEMHAFEMYLADSFMRTVKRA